MKSQIRHLLAIRLLILALGLPLSIPISAAADRSQASQAKARAKRGAATEPQLMDEEYGAKIKEYTTEKYFLTELVDHLPKSESVPTPKDVLGYVIGAPNKLTYTKDIYRYLRTLEKATPRVKTYAIGRSEEGREMMLAAVSDEANLQRIDRYKEITAKLADPRKITDEEANRLIGEGKIMYWASGSIHSPETGSPEMLMELAYRLAVENSPLISAIRKNVIVLITPASETDGRDRQVDVYNYRKANPGKTAPTLLYWGKYVAHDNNRDGMSMALALTRNMMNAFLEWHPTILHDLHESVPFLYTSTGTGPYNAWLDPIVVDEWHLLAYHEIEEMTKRGVPGVWTHGFYDGWAPNYMFYIANGHNAIGRFYETFGGRGADTGVRSVGGQATRAWYRPNPPLPRVNWSIRNNINLQQSALLFAMNFVANNGERFLRNFYLKGKRSIEKPTREGPAAYIVSAKDPRPVAAAELVNLLKRQGVEVHRATTDFEASSTPPRSSSETRGPADRAPAAGQDGDTAITDADQANPPGPRASAASAQTTSMKFPKGSFIIRMDQPYSRMADMLLDTQYYNVNDPTPYDDTGWTLGPLKNVQCVRVLDAAVLKTPMTLVEGDAKVLGEIAGSASTAGYVINHNTDNTLMSLRYRLKDIRIRAAEGAFKIGGQEFKPGSFIIPTEGNPSDLRSRVDPAVKELGLAALAVDELPKIGTHELSTPRIAILHTWTNTQNEGWFRIAFDTLQIPYAYISDHTVRDMLNLREKYDVIVFGPVGGSAQAIVRGLPMRGDPIPWKASEVTPNLGNSPDTTDDMRGGMGLQGVMNLQRFVNEGGLLVTVGGNSAIPIDYGITEGVSIQPSQQLRARGGVYNAVFAEKGSPIAYGYDDKLAVYFNQAPLFQTSMLGGIGFGGGGGGGGGAAGQLPAGQRPSGRGSTSDPDIPQGRPYSPAPPTPQVRAGEEPPIPDEVREAFGNLLPPAGARPRVVLRFAPERDLWVSGMLAGGNELANRPAVIDVPVGKGHVVMFANNPMWRQETQGSFFLLFNAALNYDHLSVGRPPSPRRADTTADDGEEDYDWHQKE